MMDEPRQPVQLPCHPSWRYWYAAIESCCFTTDRQQRSDKSIVAVVAIIITVIITIITTLALLAITRFLEYKGYSRTENNGMKQMVEMADCETVRTS